MRKKWLGMIGTALAFALPATAMAQPADRYQEDGKAPAAHEQAAQNKSSRGKAPAAAPVNATAQAGKNAAKSSPAKASGEKYGSWQSAWGEQPPAPPAHWTKTSDWYRHVRACQLHYRSYRAKTDTYHTYSGRDVRCKL